MREGWQTFYETDGFEQHGGGKLTGGLWVLKANCPLHTVAAVCHSTVAAFAVEVSTLPPAQNVVKDGV